MSQLDDAVNEAVPGGNFVKPLMIAVGALILGKMFSGKSADPDPAPPPAPQQASTGGGGLFGQLGSLLTGAAAGGAAGSALSGGAVSGGLGSLLEQFRNSGLGQQADSWVGTGQNLPISPDQINAVIGHGKLAEIAQQAGLDPAQLSQLLAQALPTVIDKLTPGGQIPKA